MSVTVRPYTPTDSDFSGIAAVEEAIHPDYPTTIEEMRRNEELRDKERLYGRFVAEENGRIVGVGGYSQWPRNQMKFWVGASVHPQAQGRGLGKQLYETILNELAQYDPITLRSDTRENQERGMRFLTDRGFTEDMREQSSALDMDRWDPTPWQDALTRAEREGITIRTYTELQTQFPDPDDLHHRLHDLHWLLDRDVPQTETPVRSPYEEWVKRFERPGFLPDANLYAMDGDQFVGATILWGQAANKDLNQGITGVTREYRKRGIATALKVRGLLFAKQYGARQVRTENEVNNTGMLGINNRLGFEKQPSWIIYVKRLREEETDEQSAGNNAV